MATIVGTCNKYNIVNNDSDIHYNYDKFNFIDNTMFNKYLDLGNPSSFDEPVDFLIPWSGITHSHIEDKYKTDIARLRFNNELYYCIKCIINNADWYNNILVLLDFEEDLYKIINKTICQKLRIKPIERGKYFLPENYPTTNICAIETIFHKIEELSEYFIYIDDDILITNKTSKGQFFTKEKKPNIIYSRVFSEQLCDLYFQQTHPHRIYVNPDICEFKTPLTFGVYTHLPCALKKSVCANIASEYNNWYMFVQSHKTRFNSTNISYSMWDLEEYMKGVWTYYLYKNNTGEMRLLDTRYLNVLIEYSWFPDKKNISNIIKENNTIFVNFNDDKSVSLEETLWGMQEVTKNYTNNINN